jgi:hypothetical protein
MPSLGPALLLYEAQHEAQRARSGRVHPRRAARRQEAAAIVIAATSGGNNLPRDIEFLFSGKRLSVAILPTHILSLVLASLFGLPWSTGARGHCLITAAPSGAPQRRGHVRSCREQAAASSPIARAPVRGEISATPSSSRSGTPE